MFFQKMVSGVTTTIGSVAFSLTDTAYVSIDKTAPTVSGAADRAANSYGWYNDDVIVSFSCSDQTGLSGIDRM